MDINRANSLFNALSQETRLRAFRRLVRAGPDGMAAGARSEALGTLQESHFATTYPVLRAFGDQLEVASRDFADPPPLEPAPIDYVNLFSRDKARARRARDRLMGR